MDIFDICIIGAGASGLMAAGIAAGRHKNVLILEQSKTVAKKLRATGGGRCNFSNRKVTWENYQSANIHFSKSALAQYNTEDFLKLMQKYTLDYEERDKGKLFGFSANRIADMLLEEALQHGSHLITEIKVKTIIPKENLFHMETSSGLYQSRNVLITTGGLSFPTLGATDTGLKIARGFGMDIITPRPALAGIKLPSEIQDFTELSGLTLKVTVSSKRKSFTDNLLFTHQGISGPAAFWISLHCFNGEPVEINFSPDTIPNTLFENRSAGRTFLSCASQVIPRSLAKILLKEFDTISLAAASKAQLEKAQKRIYKFTFIPAGTEGYSKAEVMAGGVSTADIHSSSMESKKCPGLYFAGEIIDVTGELGGYNLQWAWSSGYLAGSKMT